MSKRGFIVAAGLISLLAIIFLLLHWLVVAPNQPSYQAFQTPPTVGSYTAIHYESISPCPFEGGLMWIVIWSDTNSYHQYLYDIDRHLIRGELTHATPFFFTHDHDKLFCYSRKQSLWAKITTPIGKLISKKSRPSRPAKDVEIYWLLDLKKNSATRIGEISQSQFILPNFKPSPDFRHGLDQSSSSLGNWEVFVCDLEHSSLMKHAVPGDPIGWWDSQQILTRDDSGNFLLYNINDRRSRDFLNGLDIMKFLDDSGVDMRSSKTSAFFQWDGKENQFFLTDTHRRWQAVESFLIKVERPDGKLTLLNPKFKFEWSDHFDASAKHYLYSGRTSGQTNDAVYLRDLATGTNLTLVPTIFAKQFSAPAFYKDSIIYVRGNMLWQTDFTGTKTTCLFPPPQ